MLGIAARGIGPPGSSVRSSTIGHRVCFIRGGISVNFGSDFANPLGLAEAAEACDVPVKCACCIGVGHPCKYMLIDGTVAHSPAPPTLGKLLTCWSRPVRDIEINL